MNRSMPQTAYAQDGHLQFRGIKISDAGRYRCTAVNSAGEADAVADVVVQGKQILIDTKTNKTVFVNAPPKPNPAGGAHVSGHGGLESYGILQKHHNDKQ